MAGTTGYPSSQFKLVSGYLNSENNPAPGVPLASPSGSIVEAYWGQLGLEIRLSEDDAGKMTAPSSAVTRPSVINPPATTAAATNCLGGTYMMVRLAAGVTLGTGGVNAAVGRLVFWDLSVAPDNYQVYFAASADNFSTPLIAGVIVNPTVAQAVGNSNAALTAGNYFVIQTSGRCILQLSSTSLATTKSPYLIWSRSATAGDLGSVQYASNTTAATTFGSGNAGTAPNLTNTQLADFVGILESGNASALPVTPTAASSYVIANVPYGRFAKRT
jgi:hypothetical protein